MTDAIRPSPILEGIRVLDRSSGIAGAYCTKLLADAGADVVKSEPVVGSALRHEVSGALFEFLNTSKRSVVTEGTLLETADIVVCDTAPTAREMQRAGEGLVVVAISPFGQSGPWVGRPWTEFTLQAACGSTGQRGLPETPPLAAGGRIGEWVAGTYAALAALAALAEAKRCGQGECVDVAILDCMAVSMVTYPSVFASFLEWPPLEGTGRSIQIPSIEPSRDGCVVFTTNSAQQFQDFLVLIERPDLLEDTELAQLGKRFARRAEFLHAVRPFTQAHSSDELLQAAAAFRIPAAPVLDGADVLEFEHFVERDVFVESPSGVFRQPRVPYRIGGFAPRPFSVSPTVGADDGSVEWCRAVPDDQPRTVDRQLPLAGVRVVDLTAWWAGPSATHILAALGADVVKVESAGRPDPMRLSSTRRPPSDDWWEWGPIFHAANLSKRDLTLDLDSPDGLELLHRLLKGADILIENFTPRVIDHFGLDFASLHAENPRLIMVRMPAFGLDGPWRDRTGFAQTMEAVSGIAWRTGFEDDLPTLVLGACDPLAGAHSIFATLLALRAREQTECGMLVESVMVESALNVAAEAIVEYGESGRILGRTGNRGREAAPQGLYPCSADDTWIALAVETDAQWESLVGIIGAPPGLDGADLATRAGRTRLHDAIDDRIRAWTGGRAVEDVVALLSGAGVPAETVIAARDVVHNRQLVDRGLFEIEHHPITGDHPVPTLPFRFSHVEAWLHSASPTLGQHNDEILAELGMDEESRMALRSRAVIGERLVGS